MNCVPGFSSVRNPMPEHDQSTPTSVEDLVRLSTSIEAWGDDKRGDFVKLFHSRVQVARYLLENTADQVMNLARDRKFISQRHIRIIEERNGSSNVSRLFDRTGGSIDTWDYRAPTIGGRSASELAQIAEARAKEILNELPPLKTAIQVIAPDTAQKIARRDALLKQGEALREELEEVSEPIIMSECDPNMRLGDFLDLVRARDKRRSSLLEKLSEIGNEGSQLEIVISKALFSGIPGISDAVVDVVISHHDRSRSLDEMSRRVEEKVKFGDSETAMSLLQHFEADEAVVNDDVRQKMREALEKLNVAGTKKSTKAKPKLGGKKR